MSFVIGNPLHLPIHVEYLNKQYFATAVWSVVGDCWVVTYPWGKEDLQDVSRERAAKIMWDEMDLRA